MVDSVLEAPRTSPRNALDGLTAAYRTSTGAAQAYVRTHLPDFSWAERFICHHHPVVILRHEPSGVFVGFMAGTMPLRLRGRSISYFAHNWMRNVQSGVPFFPSPSNIPRAFASRVEEVERRLGISIEEWYFHSGSTFIGTRAGLQEPTLVCFNSHNARPSENAIYLRTHEDPLQGVCTKGTELDECIGHGGHGIKELKEAIDPSTTWHDLSSRVLISYDNGAVSPWAAARYRADVALRERILKMDLDHAQRMQSKFSHCRDAVIQRHLERMVEKREADLVAFCDAQHVQVGERGRLNPPAQSPNSVLSKAVECGAGALVSSLVVRTVGAIAGNGDSVCKILGDSVEDAVGAAMIATGDQLVQNIALEVGVNLGTNFAGAVSPVLDLIGIAVKMGSLSSANGPIRFTRQSRLEDATPRTVARPSEEIQGLAGMVIRERERQRAAGEEVEDINVIYARLAGEGFDGEEG